MTVSTLHASLQLTESESVPILNQTLANAPAELAVTVHVPGIKNPLTLCPGAGTTNNVPGYKPELEFRHFLSPGARTIELGDTTTLPFSSIYQIPLDPGMDYDYMPHDIQLPPGLPPDLESAIRTDYAVMRQKMATIKVEAEATEARAQGRVRVARERETAARAEVEDAKARENAARAEAEGARAKEGLARVEAADAKAKQTAAEDSAKAANQGIAAIRKEAEAVETQLADFKAAMEVARLEVDTTRAEVDAVQAESAEAIRIAEAAVEYWENVARGEAAEAEAVILAAREGEWAAREEVEALKSELGVVKRELEAVIARVAEAEEVGDVAEEEAEAEEEASEALDPEELDGGSVIPEEGATEPCEAMEPEEPIGGSDAKEKIMESTEQEVPREGSGLDTTIGVPPDPPTAPPPPVSSYLCQSILPPTTSIKRLWPNGQAITYCFMDGHANQHAKVAKIIPEWSRYANITFKRISRDAPSLLAISFENEWECWSCIGTDVQTAREDAPYTMALGPVSISPDATRGDRALILHQFGHALGLVHEHMCSAETDAISLNRDLIFKHPSFRGSDPSIGEYFGAYTNGSVTNYVSPDLSSIMICSMPGELNERNLKIEPNIALSPLDKAFMVINYPRTRVHSQAREWTLHHALLIAGVDETTSRTITKERDLAKRRMLFAKHLSAVRARRQETPALVDPAPKIIDNLRLPAVQEALCAFLAGHPKANEILGDKALKEELAAVLARLAHHHAIREVVHRERGKTTYLPLDTSEAGPTLVSSLLNVALMLHTTGAPAVTKHGDHPGAKQVDSVTDLCTRLAQHPIFRVAMERAVGAGRDVSETEAEAVPDVSALVARLEERPAVLRAVRQGLIGYAR